jgi:excisionase family DNA binding protein
MSMSATKPEVMRVEDEYLKIPEVCRRLSLGRTAVYGLMDRGEISYVKFGRARRIVLNSLQAYIRRATVPARTS